MADFNAKILAELDTSKAEQQLDQLGKNKKVKIDVDTGNGKANIDSINSSLKNTQKSAQSLGDSIKQALGVGSSYAIASKGIQAIEHAAKDAASAIKGFDASITNIRLATGQSYKSARELVSTYNQMGQSLGATTTEVSNSAVTWLRQGKSIKEANTLIRDSMILSKVGMLDSAQAATYLTTAMKGYKVDTQNALHIVDKMTAIDANAAIGSGQLAEAMSKTAATANTAGVSMDKLLGYIASVGEVTNDAAAAGTAFKTIFTRMRDIKAGKLELIDEDGTKELLSDVELTLKNVGIDLRATVNEFNNSGDVLDALHEKWDSLSSVQQAALTKAFAGVRQGEVFRLLMENYDNATKYMNVAADSAGTAEKKFAAYADSIEAKQKTMQAAFESLATNTFSTSLMSGLADAGTALIQFIDKTNLLKGVLAGVTVAGLTQGLSALVGLVSDAAIKFDNFNSALQILKAGNIDSSGIQALASATANLSTTQLQAVLSSEALSTSQRMAILTAQGMSEAEAQAALASMGLATAEEGATAATATFGGVVQGVWATLAANPLILVVAGVAAAVAAFSSYNQALERSRQAAQNAAEAFNTQKDSVQGQIDTIKNLREQLASGTLSEMEAYQAKQQLMDIQQQLTDTYGDQAEGISLVNGELETQIGLVNELIKSDANKFLNENMKAINKAEKEMTKTLGGDGGWFTEAGKVLGTFYDNQTDESERIKEIAKKYSNIELDDMQDGSFRVRFVGDATQAETVLNDFMTDLRSAESEFGETDALSGLFSASGEVLKDANEIIEKYKDIYEQAEQARLITNEALYAPEGSENGKTAAKWLSDYASAVKEYNLAMASDDEDRITKAKQAYETLGDTIHNMLGDESGFSQYADDVADIEKQLDSATESAIEFSDALTGKSTDEKSSSIRELTQELKDLQMTDTGFLDLASFGEGTEDGYQAVKNLLDIGKEFGYSTDTETGLSAFASMLSDAGVLIKATSEEVDEATSELTGTLDDLNTVFDGSDDGFGEAIETYRKELEQLQKAREKWNAGELTLDDMLDLQMTFKDLNGYDMSNLDDGLNELMDSIIGTMSETSDATGMMGLFDAAINSVGGDATPAGQALARMRDNIIALYSDTATAEQQTQKTIGDIVSTYQAGFSKVQEVLNAQSTGKSISASDFASDELKDYTSALEYHNGVLQYNAEKVAEISKAKAEETKETIAANKAMEQSKYLENAGQIEKLREQLKTASDSEKSSIQDTINSLLAENSQIVATCSQYDLMTSSINEATSAYQNWLNAQGAAQSGDMFDSSLQAMKKINDTLNDSSSDDYGRIGNQDYKAAVDFVVPDTIDHEDSEAVNSYLDSIKNYLTFDSNGNADGLNIGEFCNKAVEAGLMTFDDASEEYQIAGQKTMQDFAEGLGLALPLVQAMFGEMEEFGGNFDWADEAEMSFGDLAVKANEAAEALRQVEGNEDLKIVLDVSDFENKEVAIDTLNATIEQMNDLKAQPDVDTTQIEQANSVIQYCVAQQQLLNTPAVMSVDTSQVTGETGKALALLQQFQEAKNNIEMQASIGADTSEAESSLASLTSEVQSLSPEIKATLGIDDTSTETITSSIEGLSPEMIVEAGVDSSLVDAYISEEKTSKGTTIWDNNTSAVDAYAGRTKTSAGTVRWGNDVSLVRTTFTASGTVHWTNVGAKVNGTAHASGTANAGGNWGTAPGGKTLVGELGREIVVDPRTGQWYTVGDNGAEFRDIPRNAIVFNHLQSESLLENGYAVGRATALARGTALVKGGIKIPTQKIQNDNNKGYRGTSNSNSGSGNRTSSSGSSSSSSKKDDDTEKINYIEMAIDRIQRSVEKFKRTAENIYKSFSKRNKALNNEIKSINKEIKIQEKGAERYKKEADKVDISSAIKRMVREGSINIEEYDSDTAKKIQEYQQWYEKMLDCKKAASELKDELAEIAAEQFDLTISKYDGAVQKLEHSMERTKSLIDRRSDFASDYVTPDNATTASQKNIEAYQKLVGQSQKDIAKKEEELAALREQLQASLSQGVKKNSEGYREMEQKIYDVENDIDDLYSDIIGYSNAISKEYVNMFDAVGTEFENKLSQSEHLANEYNTALETAEAKGFLASENYYKMLRDIENANINTLKAEYEQLMTAMTNALASGEIEKGSQAWYDMTAKINETAEAIQKAELNVVELSNSIRQVKWDNFDYMEDQISQLTSEADFFISLMKDAKMLDDNGSFTSEGLATAGLHGQNYNTLMLQADDYAKQIKDINEEIENNPADTNLISRKQELYAAQQKAILAANNEKQAIRDLVENGIKAELSSIKDLINEYTSALDAQKDLYDFQKKIEKQTKNIASLRKQLAAYENDLSEETRAKVQKIRVSLEDAEDELEQTEYEKFIKDQKKLLNDLYDEYEKVLNERLDNIDFLIEEMIATINSSADEIYKTISTSANNVGYSMSESMMTVWNSQSKANADNIQNRIAQCSYIVSQLVANGSISKENAKQITNALAKGDLSAVQNAVGIIQKLTENGQLSKANANSLLATLSNGNSSAVQNALDLVAQMRTNGSITSAEAAKLLNGIVAQDINSQKDAIAIITQLVKNGGLASQDASKILTGMTSSDAQQAMNASKIVTELLANGQITQSEAAKILAGIVSPNQLSDLYARDAVERLTAIGAISDEQAKTILSGIESSTNESSTLAMYSRNFSDKMTTLNYAVSDIKAGVLALVAQANAEAEAARIRAQQEANEKAAAEEKALRDAANANPTKQDAKAATTTKKATTTTKKATTTKKPALTDDIKKHVAAAIWNGNYGWGNDPDRSKKLEEVFGKNNGIQAIVNKGYNYVKNVSSSGYSYLDMRKKFKGYSSGLKHATSNEFAWTNEDWDKVGSETIVRSSDHAVLTRVGTDDRIYNAMASSNLWEMANNPARFIASKSSGYMGGSPVNDVNNVINNLEHVEIKLPNVQNYEQFVEQMKKDKKFEYLIQNMTLGAMMGRNKKNIVHWNERS